MSAAATAAGYLYASGRLRGRAQREQDHEHENAAKPAPKSEGAGEPRKPRVAALRKDVRVAALPPSGVDTLESRPRRQPTIQYRVRRWRPGQDGGE